jgi:hypothetical protein
MEPEDRFDQEVEGREEVVAAADVTEFVGEDGFEFRVFEAVCDAGGEPEDGAEDAEYAGLEVGGGGDEAWGCWQAKAPAPQSSAAATTKNAGTDAGVAGLEAHSTKTISRT